MRKINESCYYFSSAVNIGYIHEDGAGMLIDSGIDDSSIKKVLKILEREGLPLDYCVITHAHADHFGGASYLKKQKRIQLYAPKLESAIIENPLLEPVYLWNGAFPVRELRNKFLEGKPADIDGYISPGKAVIGPFSLEFIHLPGHSIGQAGVIFKDILFAADAYFGKQALEKHVIPFITDAGETIDTLKRLKGMDSLKGAVPGHGEFEESIDDTLNANIAIHKSLMENLVGILQMNNGKLTFEELLKKFLDDNKIEAGSLGQLLLYRTTFTAYITKLVSDESLMVLVEGNTIYVSI